MKSDKININPLFEKFQESDWEIYDLEVDHKKRFSTKLKSKKSNVKKWYFLSIAASILVLLGMTLFLNNNTNTSNEFEYASKETFQTDSIYSVIIKNHLNQILEKKNPKNEKIINDALQQMEAMDQDYEKIKHELEVNGESKQIIYALLSSLQTRISFLQNVLDQLELNTTTLNTQHDEKTL